MISLVVNKCSTEIYSLLRKKELKGNFMQINKLRMSKHRSMKNLLWILHNHIILCF